MIKATYTTYNFLFSFPAKTSRDTLYEKQTYFIILKEHGKTGIGECSFIAGLSIEDVKDIPQKIHDVIKQINEGKKISDIELSDFPSIRFGLETALLDLHCGGARILYPSAFTKNEDSIPINGLIWMGEKAFLKEQIDKKIAQEFSCIKLKVGALDLKTELEMLTYIRQEYSEKNIEIRLDANGAYTPENALETLKQFSEYSIHSIEQPIAPNQHERMAELSEKSPIPIALDEELLPRFANKSHKTIIETIKPQYLILKPGLLGGFSLSSEIIDIAKENNISWWITSALESNIGLNAISQWTYALNHKDITHGLGTGQIYNNNISSPLEIIKASLHYTHEPWDVSNLVK